MKSLAAYVMRGRLQALVMICSLAVASMMLPPISLLSTALMALVVLRKGAKESAWVLLLSLLCLGLSGSLLAGEVIPVVAYGVLLWLPVWPVAAVLRVTRRLDWALETASVLGLLVVLAVYLLAESPAALWREKMQLFLQAMSENASSGFEAGAMEKVLDFFSHYLTGAMAAASVMSVILALLIARWQQAVLFNPGGFRSEFVSLRVSAAWVLAALSTVAAGFLAGGYIAEFAWNLNAVFLVLFIIIGLSVLHAVMGGKRFWIAGIYFGLFIFPQLLLPPIALLGFSDIWLDWRKLGRRV